MITGEKFVKWYVKIRVVVVYDGTYKRTGEKPSVSVLPVLGELMRTLLSVSVTSSAKH